MQHPKKIVLPGGSGQVGGILARALQRRGHEVVVLSRAAGRAPGQAPWRVVPWDGRTLGEWAEQIDGADAVINLAGHSVNCRYGSANRTRILRSRVDSTRVVGEAIERSQRPPAVWLQAGTATIYAHRYDAPNDERSGRIGGGEPGAPDTWRFSIQVARAWERTLAQAHTPHTRRVNLRSAMVMSPDPGGVFDVLLGLVRRGLGGRAGDGRQFVSWIHQADFVRAVEWLLEPDALEGNVNLAAPEPLPNAAFMAALRRAWGMPLGLPAARWMLELGAIFLRTETELVLKSRRVVPGRLLEAGFRFDHPAWPEAAVELVSSWRALRDCGMASRSGSESSIETPMVK